MKVKCSKCGSILLIAENKLPKNKKKAMVKCKKCNHSIVFTIPNAGEPEGEKTEIGDANELKIQNVKLIETKTGKEYILKIGKNIIGRKTDISIEGDKYISRLHCLVEMKKQTWGIELTISDDGTETGKPSTNGTFYKDEKISKFDKIVLKNGDKIRVGRTDLTVKFY